MAMFLDLPPNSIGSIGGGKVKRAGIVDVAVIQSLRQNHSVQDFVAEYGQVPAKAKARPAMSAEARAKIAAAQKARWAKLRKLENKGTSRTTATGVKKATPATIASQTIRK